MLSLRMVLTTERTAFHKLDTHYCNRLPVNEMSIAKALSYETSNFCGGGQQGPTARRHRAVRFDRQVDRANEDQSWSWKPLIRVLTLLDGSVLDCIEQYSEGLDALQICTS
jgi:hypothetical protein